jgi:hypothetical protein
MLSQKKLVIPICSDSHPRRCCQTILWSYEPSSHMMDGYRRQRRGWIWIFYSSLLLLSRALHSMPYASLIIRRTCTSCHTCEASVRRPKNIFLQRPVYLESPSSSATSEPYLWYIQESSKDSLIPVADFTIVICLFVLYSLNTAHRTVRNGICAFTNPIIIIIVL